MHLFPSISIAGSENRVDIEDLSAIYYTIHAIIFAAKVLIIVTLGVNIIALIRARKMD